MWLLPPPLRTHSSLWASRVWVVLGWVLLGGGRRAVALAIWAALSLFHAFALLACIGLN